MSTPKKNRLSKMSFDSVSLVGRGDDPLAQVVISKADPTDIEKDEDMGDKKTEIEKDGLDADVLEYIEALETENVDLSKELVDMTAAKDEAISKAASDSTDDFEELVKSADPAVAKVLRAQKEAIEKADKAAEAERDIRLDREYIAKAETLPMLDTPKVELAGILRRVAENKTTKEDTDKLEKMLQTANDNIREGGILKEFGKSGEESTISKSVEAAAEAIRKAEPTLTKEQATARAYKENPDLFTQAMAEEQK